MPIVGQFGSLSGLGSLVLPGGAMESIATVTVGSGGAASIDFADIPGTFQHLQLRVMTPLSISDGVLDLQYNGVTSGYANHALYGNGSTAAAAGETAKSSFQFAYDGNSSRNSSMVRTAIVDILDYASTSKNKTARALSGVDTNGIGFIEIRSSLFATTSALTSLKLRQYGADAVNYGFKNFAQHTTAALYGLRAP